MIQENFEKKKQPRMRDGEKEIKNTSFIIEIFVSLSQTRASNSEFVAGQFGEEW